MWQFRRRIRERDAPGPALDRLRAKYASFRELLALNNECLELMAGIPDDLQYVAPRSPDGFVLTTEAYRKYCGVPLWEDAARDLDVDDLDGVETG
jgi:hypothetical protein